MDIVLELDNGATIGIESKAAATMNDYEFKGLAQLDEFSGKKFCCGIVLDTGSRLLSFKINNQAFDAVPISVFWSLNK